MNVSKSKQQFGVFRNITEWLGRKTGKKIDITLPKYDGSTDIGNSPILCIKNVQKRNDEGIYTIIVHNKLGEGNDNSKLVIIEGMIHVKNKCSTCSSVAIIQCRDYLDLKITFLNWIQFGFNNAASVQSY